MKDVARHTKQKATRKSAEIQKHEPIDEQLKAYRARDLEKFVSFYADSIEVFRNEKLVATGRPALEQMYKGVFDSSPNLAIKISERRVRGSYVYDTEHITGLRGNPDEIVATVRYKIEDSKIVEVQIKF